MYYCRSSYQSLQYIKALMFGLILYQLLLLYFPIIAKAIKHNNIKLFILYKNVFTPNT